MTSAIVEGSTPRRPRLGPPHDDTTVERPPASGVDKEAESTLGQVPARSQSWNSPSGLWLRKTTVIAALSIAAILVHLVLRFGFHTTAGTHQIPLLATLALGGLPLLSDLLRKLLKREFGSDLLGGMSIVTSVLLGQKSPHRVNVALSRAMDRLFVVGAANMWTGSNASLPLGQAMAVIRELEQQGRASVMPLRGLFSEWTTSD